MAVGGGLGPRVMSAADLERARRLDEFVRASEAEVVRPYSGMASLPSPSALGALRAQNVADLEAVFSRAPAWAGDNAIHQLLQLNSMGC